MLAAFAFMAMSAIAQTSPAEFFADADGEKGAALKTALFRIIHPDKQLRTYANLWTDFQLTDKRADGLVWDMYSCTSNFKWGTSGNQDTGSGGTTEGDKYNREHSFPNSWFGGQKGHAAYTDLFHMYPCDKLVNNKRSNHPFGDVANPSWTSNQQFSKLGPCSTPGYSGTAFEPADEYKGDFARTYFYMATAYESEFAAWAEYGDSQAMLAGNAYPGYKQWAVELLLRWAEQDPVSEKEIKRNQAVYEIQGNRNPYIDYPGLEQYVWGKFTKEPFSVDHYLTPEQLTGIVPTTIDDASIVVYDLQGRRINPSRSKEGNASHHGILIRGGKTIIR